jgi:two-component system, LytTR family, response regulator
MHPNATAQPPAASSWLTPLPVGEATQREVPAAPLRRFTIRERGRLTFVELDEVEAIEAHGNCMLLHTSSARHRVRQTLESIERRLDQRFIRIHRSHIVRFDQVREVQFLLHGDCSVRLRDGRSFRVGRKYRDALRALIRASEA